MPRARMNLAPSGGTSPPWTWRARLRTAALVISMAPAFGCVALAPGPSYWDDLITAPNGCEWRPTGVLKDQDGKGPKVDIPPWLLRAWSPQCLPRQGRMSAT